MPLDYFWNPLQSPTSLELYPSLTIATSKNWTSNDFPKIYNDILGGLPKPCNTGKMIYLFFKGIPINFTINYYSV